jgi:hypothetical protein
MGMATPASPDARGVTPAAMPAAAVAVGEQRDSTPVTA